jgi:transposase InsO family protein
MDWHTCELLSWRISNTLEADFCVDALKDAHPQVRRARDHYTDSRTIGASCGSVLLKYRSINRCVVHETGGASIAACAADYNTKRPHTAFDYQSPPDYAA